MDAFVDVPSPVNEPVLTYAPGTPERAELEKTLAEAESLTQTEVKIRAELGKGMTLAQALEQYGHV